MPARAGRAQYVARPAHSTLRSPRSCDAHDYVQVPALARLIRRDDVPLADVPSGHEAAAHVRVGRSEGFGRFARFKDQQPAVERVCVSAGEDEAAVVVVLSRQLEVRRPVRRAPLEGVFVIGVEEQVHHCEVRLQG